jgi:predicted RNA-binding protein with PUA-like domain
MIGMKYWLLKTEPDCYSFADLVREKRTTWDGVTNSWALQFLRQIGKGDRVLIYHTGKEKAVAGVAEVVKAAYADPSCDDEKLAVVDLKPVKALASPVTLAQIKKDRRFADFELVKFSRLGVMPVSPERFEMLLAMGGS